MIFQGSVLRTIRLVGLSTALICLALPAQVMAADYTPYADSVAETGGSSIGNPNNALGAPDNSKSSFLSVNGDLVLDMGQGQEGTNTLKVYLAPVGLQTTMVVQLLDTDKNVLKQAQWSLFLNLSQSVQNVDYNWTDTGKAYRYVRISNPVGIGGGVDAVEALGYIGSTSTQDTDGDGIPDREDSQPLIFNTGSGGSGSGSNNSGGSKHSSKQKTFKSATNTSGKSPRGSGLIGGTSGSSVQVNPPPKPNNDKDGDQMADDWERAHGLNPNNADDAGQDPDKDGLTNLEEYQINTDPHNPDTDMDGIPDGWEFDNGLNALVNDAAQDPDRDYLNNLGEYHFNTNPYRADRIMLEAQTKPYKLLAAAAVAIGLGSLTVGSIWSARPKSGAGALYKIRHRLYKLLNRKV